MKNSFLTKSYTLNLTVPRMLALAIGTLLILSWFFFLGLVVGRGYLPEQTIPRLAEVMPKPQSGTVAVAPETGDAPGQIAKTLADNENKGKPNGRDVIAKADKEYRESVSKEKLQTSPPSLTVPATTQQTASSPAATSDPTVFTYVYQLASFKDESGAKALSAKLAKAGYKTRIATSQGAKSKWYRVMLDYTGTTAQAEKMAASLQTFKIGKPLLLSRTKRS